MIKEDFLAKLMSAYREKKNINIVVIKKSILNLYLYFET